MKLFSRVLSAVMVLAMIFCLTSCGDNSWVYEYDGERVTSGVYLTYLLDGYSQVASYDEISSDESGKDIFSLNVADGTSVSDEIVKVTKQSIAEMLYAKSELKKAGVEFDQANIDSLKSYGEYMFENYSSLYEPNGVGAESYKTYYSNFYFKDLYFTYLYTDTYKDLGGGAKAPAAEELLKYYEDNYVSYYMLQANFSTDVSESETVTADEAQANANANQAIVTRFEDYAKRINAGTAFEDIRAEEAKATGTELPTDEKTGEVTPLEPTIADVNDLTSSYPEINEALAAMKDGEAKYIETDTVAYLIVKGTITAKADDPYYINNEANVRYSLKSDEFNDFLKEQTANMDIKVNNYAVKFYAPKKLSV